MRLPDIALCATKTQKLVSGRTHNSLKPISPLICLVVVCSLVVIAIEILLGLRLLGKNLTRAQPNRAPSPPPPPPEDKIQTPMTEPKTILSKKVMCLFLFPSV